MTSRRFLEEFRPPTAARKASADSDANPEAIESARSEGFERGYASGWEDATRASEKAKMKIDAELARNIQDLGFTFHEASEHLRGEILNLVTQFTESFIADVLPTLMRETARSQMQAVLEDGLEADIQIVASADAFSIMEDLLRSEDDLAFELVQEDTLAPHQIFIRFGPREIDVNFSALIEAFTTQVTALTASQQHEAVNGQ